MPCAKYSSGCCSAWCEWRWWGFGQWLAWQNIGGPFASTKQWPDAKTWLDCHCWGLRQENIKGIDWWLQICGHLWGDDAGGAIEWSGCRWLSECKSLVCYIMEMQHYYHGQISFRFLSNGANSCWTPVVLGSRRCMGLRQLESRLQYTESCVPSYVQAFVLTALADPLGW